jgi:dinuclear metal center YbgI/SA1388 family protein
VPSLGAVTAALDRLYDPRLAEDWDAVGSVCGDPEAPVRRVLFAVDPAAAVVTEALTGSADLIVTHHPLFFRPVHGVPATDPRGALVHRLIAGGVGLHVAHTNADVADPGVSDALAGALGVTDVAPLQPRAEPTDGLVTFAPAADVPRLLDALAAAGAGAVGDYTRCAFLAEGTGTFQAGPDTHPAVGRPGRREAVAETRVELTLPRRRRSAVLAALRAAHPYEEPVLHLVELVAGRTAASGLGRVGALPGAGGEPLRLAQFARRVAAALPATPAGVRVAGDPDRPVRRVAVCGGAGGELAAEAAAAGADLLVTADLRHHVTADAVAATGIALIDAGHWATEWPWLGQAADRLAGALAGTGTTVETIVSSVVTDPWTVHAAGPSAGQGAGREGSERP